MNIKPLNKVIILLLIVLLGIVGSSVLVIPDNLFSKDYSTVILDRNGRLLGAKLSYDEQWRFKPTSEVPDKFKKAILTFEDQYFYNHPGINIVSIFSSLLDNIEAGKVVRGGSTISMQVIRLSRNGKKRTIIQKLIESYLTIGLEVLYSKDSILNIYCSHAPMGGNIIGLNAASWRYFGHAQHELSWAEAATLAVLPNAPSLIHPGKNRQKLIDKRNGLLLKMLELEYIDSTQYRLAILEEIPNRPKPLPNLAQHLLEYLCISHRGEIIQTTIDYGLQYNAYETANGHSTNLLHNGINNAAVLLVRPIDKQVLAYIGNLSSNSNIRDQYNDMVRANRSTGSILKPFLYASMIGEGLLLPNSLVRDIPSYFNNYHPVNYNDEFSGAVPASMALSQSLNVPAVYMLQNYGIAKFLRKLNKLGLSSFDQSADYYGLSLVLGGGEASLLELVNAYAGMATTLLSYDNNYGEYPPRAYGKLNLILNETIADTEINADQPPLSASSIWLTYDALKNVSRPATEIGWENFNSSSDIAWKTGTSHGFKDAWAIGTTADYVVGVWVGNADGEGRNGLSGTKSAAPIMFDIYNTLSNPTRFHMPYDEMADVEICKQSGNLASPNCPDIDTNYVCIAGQESKVCNYHKLIFMDKENQYQVSQKCYSVADMVSVPWFVLPPIQESYYKDKHPGYSTLPPYAPGCEPNQNSSEIEFIYPISGESIYMVIDVSGKQREIVFKVSHHYPKSTIYWHLDSKLIGITKDIHNLAYKPSVGKHILTVVDESGRYESVSFGIVK